MFIRRIELQVISEKVVSYRSIPHGIPKIRVKEPADVFELFSFLSKRVQEEVYALYLNVKNDVIGFYQVSKGASDNTVVNPADVLRPALLAGATGVILVHNHPSGDPQPSFEDKKITQKVREACSIMGFKFIDHIIIGQGCYKSFND